MWCLERNVYIQAQYLPGVLNYTTDQKSQSMKDNSDWRQPDWRLEKHMFLKIMRPLEVDLFASRLTNQCRRYFSWWPDPYAEANNAFLQDWLGIEGLPIHP